MVRTMVGRIEIVTPQQRELLARLGASNDTAEQLKCYGALGRFKEVLLENYLLRGGRVCGGLFRRIRLN
ncbi:MAG TPA: hypothetical protein VGQ99_10855 [Tepidisphaeraceae bacterium]|nr:hypothetical protein [Tepidisphaeraceae bacterium]